jgi:hypothetical protein
VIATCRLSRSLPGSDSDLTSSEGEALASVRMRALSTLERRLDDGICRADDSVALSRATGLIGESTGRGSLVR